MKDIIEELANRKGVKKIAVENFLMSLGESTKEEALANLNYDTQLYNWNSVTYLAIREGIKRLIK